jgi:hypothetical protein
VEHPTQRQLKFFIEAGAPADGFLGVLEIVDGQIPKTTLPSLIAR